MKKKTDPCHLRPIALLQVVPSDIKLRSEIKKTDRETNEILAILLHLLSEWQWPCRAMPYLCSLARGRTVSIFQSLVVLKNMRKRKGERKARKKTRCRMKKYKLILESFLCDSFDPSFLSSDCFCLSLYFSLRITLRYQIMFLTYCIYIFLFHSFEFWISNYYYK